MRYKLILVVLLINIFIIKEPLLGQAVPKRDSIGFDFDKTKVYTRPLNYTDLGVLIKIKRDSNVYASLVFENQVIFAEAYFQNTATFKNSQFQNIASFSSSRFQYTALFSGSEFDGEAGFDISQFRNTADFSGARFQKKADFSGATFQKNADFELAEFQGNADFRGASFQKNADFRNAEFKKKADFSGLALSDSTIFDFSNASLPDLINFSGNTKIQNTIDFSTADFGLFERNYKLGLDYIKYRYINLYNSDIAKVKIDYDHFRLCFYTDEARHSAFILNVTFFENTLQYNNKKFLLTDSSVYLQLLKYKEIRTYLKRIFPSIETQDPSGSVWYRIMRNLPWYKKNHTESILPDTAIKNFLKNCIKVDAFPSLIADDDIISTYEKVLKNFEVSGQKISYETLDIEYQDFKNGWFIIPHIWNCYGYHKEWIFYWGLGFIILFTIITWFLLDKLNGKTKNDAVYHMANIPIVVKEKTILSFFRRVWYSLMYTSTIFFLLTLKVENLNFKKGLVSYILIVYAVGLLCLGYMANFILQK